MKLTNTQKIEIQLLISKEETNDKIQIYKENGTDDYIIELLQLQKRYSTPKQWGVFMEKVAQQNLQLEDSINSEHDKILDTKKIEIKTSTMLFNSLKYKNKKVFQYNSIRLDYDYDYLLLQNLNFNSIDYYIISKDKIKELTNILWLKQKQKKKDIIQMIQFNDIEQYLIEVDSNNINDYIGVNKDVIIETSDIILIID